MNEKTIDIDFAAFFAAGAASAAYRHGMSEKSAESFVEGICKEAARGRYILDDEDDTFWNRNKKWIVPALVGTIAFYLGADGERYKRPEWGDKSYVSNAGHRLMERVKTLFGIVPDPLFDSMTKVKPIDSQGAPKAENNQQQ